MGQKNFLMPPFSAPAAEHTAKAATSAATMVDPTGVPARIEIRSPASAHITDSTAEQIVTDLKLPKIRMADIARIEAESLFDRDWEYDAV